MYQKKMHAAFVLILLLSSTKCITGISEEDHTYEDGMHDVSLLFTPSPDDELDRKQTGGSETFPLYDTIWAAQSFQPKVDILTRIRIQVNHTNTTESVSRPRTTQVIRTLFKKMTENIAENCRRNQHSFVSELLRRTMASLDMNMIDQPGLITLSIRKDLNGADLALKTYPYELVLDTKYWLEYDMTELPVEPGKTYYIIVHTEGGDETDFFNWFYCDGVNSSITNGSEIAYSSTDTGNSWHVLHDGFDDFNFETYGRYSYKEPEDGDGITDYWAIVCGDTRGHDPIPVADDAAERMYALLKTRNFNEDHMRLLTDEALDRELYSAIAWMDEMDDGDDICFYFAEGHANSICTRSSTIERLERCGSKGIAVIVDTCYGGKILDDLGDQDGWVISVSSQADEISWWYYALNAGVFTYYTLDGFQSLDADTNQDGWISAEEAFYYAKEPTWDYAHKQHPEMFDGYRGDLPLIET